MQIRLVGVLSAGLVLGACAEDVVEAPTIVSFTASAAQVGLGDRVQLSWNVTGATGIDIDATPGGSLIKGATAAENTVPSAPVTAATRFVLTAHNAEGRTATADLMVSVDASILRISRFVAEPAEIDPGESATLSWTVAGSPIGKVRVLGPAGAVLYDGVNATGTQVVSPEVQTTYTLEVSNIAQSISEMTTVNVRANPPSIVRFEAMPNPAATGARGTISWQTERADEVQIMRDGQVVRPWNTNGAASGFTSFTFSEQSSVFTLQARNGFGEVSQDVTVTTLNPPTAMLVLTRDRFTTTTATIGIHWETANADTVTLTVGGRAPAGFTGQAMGDLVVTATRTLEVVLNGTSPIDTVTERAQVRRISVFTQDVTTGDAATPLTGAAVRVEDGTGARFYEALTDGAGRATLEIEAEMYPVSVSVAMANHFAAAVVGLAAPMAGPIRIDPIPTAVPPQMTEQVQGTFFNKGALGDRILITGAGVEGFEGTGISYMMAYDTTNAPLTLVALDFDAGDRLINGVVTSTVRTGGMMSVPITFPRPALVPVNTVVTVRVPSTGAFTGQRYTLGGQVVVQQRDDAIIVVGDSIIGALAGGAVPWTITSFAEPGFEVTLAGVAINGTSLRVVAFARSVGAPATIDLAALPRLELVQNGPSLGELTIDFDGLAYDALVVNVGPQAVPGVYRVVLPADHAHVGARIPHLPSTVGFRGLGIGAVNNVIVGPGAHQYGGAAAQELGFDGPAVGYPAELRYAIERPAVQATLTGF